VGVGELVDQYRAGAEIKQLATHFNVNRDTVFSIMNRRQVVRRQRGVLPNLVDKVITDYQTGSSLAVTESSCLLAQGRSLRVYERRVCRYVLDKVGTTTRSRAASSSVPWKGQPRPGDRIAAGLTVLSRYLRSPSKEPLSSSLALEKPGTATRDTLHPQGGSPLLGSRSGSANSPGKLPNCRRTAMRSSWVMFSRNS
jgi:hypothetical protein